jgi:hypothetical protein
MERKDTDSVRHNLRYRHRLMGIHFCAWALGYFVKEFYEFTSGRGSHFTGADSCWILGFDGLGCNQQSGLASATLFLVVEFAMRILSAYLNVRLIRDKQAMAHLSACGQFVSRIDSMRRVKNWKEREGWK